jgi:hypothetical protein
MNDPKHKGTEFTNISEVWEQNERNDAPEDATSNRETLGDENLEQVIEEEAADYDSREEAPLP